MAGDEPSAGPYQEAQHRRQIAVGVAEVPVDWHFGGDLFVVRFRCALLISERVFSYIGVRMAGAMALTVIPERPHSLATGAYASDRVQCSILIGRKAISDEAFEAELEKGATLA